MSRTVPPVLFSIALFACGDSAETPLPAAGTTDSAASLAAGGDSSGEHLPLPVLQSCAGKSAGDACSARVLNHSLSGVCTALPFGRLLACLPPPPISSCARCGDGVVSSSSGEQCDPGPAGFTATCNVNCTTSVCGDGIVNAAAGEQCDPGTVGGFTSSCNSNCTIARCGDGIVNIAAGEVCDTGGESATCNANCTVSSCGDRIVNRAAGEECDDGPLGSTFCNPNCTVRR
jgi:hypothetical protein